MACSNIDVKLNLRLPWTALKYFDPCAKKVGYMFVYGLTSLVDSIHFM